MRVLVIYDIANDRARLKVADACEDFGLDRIQFSAFSGELSRTHQESLMQRVRKLIEEVGGSVWLLPVAANDWEKRIRLEFEAENADKPVPVTPAEVTSGPPAPLVRRPDDPF
jgi:CRISPR-associated protein Cas2